MTREDIYHDLLSFIVRELLNGEHEDVDGSTPLLETGILDSISLVQLIAHIESTLDVVIPNAEVKPKHFATLDAVVDLVLRARSR